MFKSTEEKKRNESVPLGFITLPCHYGFSIFPARQEKTTPPPSTSHHTIEWMNLELLTVWQRVTYTASSWLRVWKESTRYPVHDWNTWKKNNETYLIEPPRPWVKGNLKDRDRKWSDLSFPRATGNPLDILQTAYRTWERSTLFWNIFIPSKSKENPTSYRGMNHLNWKIFDIERVTC